MDQDESGLRNRLKRLTKPFHRDVEMARYPRLLIGGTISQDQFRAYLGCLRAVHSAWEPVVCAMPEWKAFGLDIQMRRRLPLLEKDLASCGGTTGAHSPTWFPRSFAEAAGLMYVLEGSTMGGRILADKIARMFAGTEFAACTSYFCGYGEANADRWDEYCHFLDAFGEARPDLLPYVIAGACAAFVAMHEVLDADQS